MSKFSELDADRQQIERLTDVVRPPTFAESARAGAHTPTPWEYRPHRHDDWGWIRGPKGDAEFGPLVATARSGSWDTVDTLGEHRRNGTDPFGANAALIVKAVNNHESLLAALKSIAEWRKVNLTAEYEHGLRDVIRSITDCAAAALTQANL
jgi:hypothetical protein